jgi:hypothetical protein
MKKIYITIGLLFATIVTQGQVSTKELLARAYQQASLSQQITKSYISLVLKIDKKDNRQKLQNDALTFSDELEELEVELLTIGMDQKLIPLQEAWLDYRKIIFGGGYTQKKVTQLAKANHTLLAANQELCNQLRRVAERDGIKMITEEHNDIDMIEMVGKQNIYAHTIPSYYMLKTVGLKHTLCMEAYHTCIIEYEDNLQEIIPLVDTSEYLGDAIRNNLVYWASLEGICTKMIVKSESIEEFYPLLNASNGLSQTNLLLLEAIVEMSYE